PVPPAPQENGPRKPYSTAQNSSPVHSPTQPTLQPEQNHSSQRASPQPLVSRNVRPAFDESNRQQYYPKSYHQASEIHSLPPCTPRSITPPQPDQGNSSVDHGHSQSHKDSNHGQGKDSQ